MREHKEKIEQYIKDGLLVRRYHKNGLLQILNYTQRVQYDRLWDDLTMQCRGLILDSEYNVLARPFKKFFNWSELKSEDIPNEPFEVYTKLDGSLGIIYWIDDVPYVATRGSFESEQAIRATKILHEKYSHIFPILKRDRTYLFEIIYPQNRIVIDYSGLEDLILLAVIDNATGKDLPLQDIWMRIVTRHDGINDVESLKLLEKDNEEGFVIKFQSGMRCKVKFSEYVRLHKILTQTSNIAIWECLKNGNPLDELLERIPDEFFKWVKSTKEDLESQYHKIQNEALAAYNRIHYASLENGGVLNRKTFAIEVMKSHKKISGVLFNMLDNKDCAQVIWKMLRPEYSKPFKTEIDA